MSKVLRVPFSQEGFELAASWLETYATRTLPKNCVDLISQMTRTGETWAMTLMNHIDTGETLASIHGYRNGDKGVIVAGGNAIWIEFGTGTRYNGEGFNHPKAQELNMSPHGTYTWYGNLSGLPHGADPNGWWYKGDDGQYHHTYGIPANRFMYNTAQMLRRECPTMAREVFK